jgi:hypothetical protein
VLSLYAAIASPIGKAMPAPFNYQRRLGDGTKNAMVARLTVQVAKLLQYCGADQKLSQEITALYEGSMIKRLLRCSEIEQRIRGDIEKAELSRNLGDDGVR